MFSTANTTIPSIACLWLSFSLFINEYEAASSIISSSFMSSKFISTVAILCKTNFPSVTALLGPRGDSTMCKFFTPLSNSERGICS
ncbi:hypothetical protein DFH05DRAFT_1478017 [Lentinula detonsa]|uniref:Secreted protein n=1 Tax=Lentinula detonsa TaxID=2804962 RepID=A0A9W8P9N5_9AGAR|nr:hypothetical protein DFH05DRAFT_1478017 [Lentinula detonsa]